MTRIPPDDGGGLFPPARHDGPETSHQAARSMAEVAPRDRERVLACIREAGAGGLADFEGQAALEMLAQSWTPRRRELAKLGLVVDSGRKRKTPRNRSAIVWVASEFAQAGGGA